MHRHHWTRFCHTLPCHQHPLLFTLLQLPTPPLIRTWGTLLTLRAIRHPLTFLLQLATLRKRVFLQPTLPKHIHLLLSPQRTILQVHPGFIHHHHHQEHIHRRRTEFFFGFLFWVKQIICRRNKIISPLNKFTRLGAQFLPSLFFSSKMWLL